MSLEKINQHIRELEAIKSYGKVKSERDRLLLMNRGLEAELASERAKVRELSKTVEAKGKEIENLKNNIRSSCEEIKRMKEKIEQLKLEIRELKEVKVTAEGKTLAEAEKAFLKAKGTEIRKCAETLLDEMKLAWEKDEKPKEVSRKAVQWLKHVVDGLSKPGPRFFLKELVDAGLPEKVEEIINSEVDRRVDAKFLERVEESSELKALEKLEHLKSVEWPSWYRLNVEPKIRELEDKISTNAIKLLKGPWSITCNQCGGGQSIEFTQQGIESLLRNGYVEVECENPNCVDSSLFSKRRHKIKIPLTDLIATCL